MLTSWSRRLAQSPRLVAYFCFLDVWKLLPTNAVFYLVPEGAGGVLAQLGVCWIDAYPRMRSMAPYCYVLGLAFLSVAGGCAADFQLRHSLGFGPDL